MLGEGATTSRGNSGTLTRADGVISPEIVGTVTPGSNAPREGAEEDGSDASVSSVTGRGGRRGGIGRVLEGTGGGRRGLEGTLTSVGSQTGGPGADRRGREGRGAEEEGGAFRRKRADSMWSAFAVGVAVEGMAGEGEERTGEAGMVGGKKGGKEVKVVEEGREEGHLERYEELECPVYGEEGEVLWVGKVRVREEDVGVLKCAGVRMGLGR